MQFYIGKNGKQTGPFSEGQVRTMLSNGSVAVSDWCWHEGLSDWLPISQVLADQRPPPLPLSSAPLANGKKVAIEKLERLADEGDPVAARHAMELHAEYLSREELETASGKARCIALAESGDRIAMMHLFFAYAGNNGFERDHVKSRHWCTRAAESGWAEGQFWLGHLHESESNIHGKPDYLTAAYWYGRAIQLGHPGAMQSLAILYLNGQGVKQSAEVALYWYFLSLHEENPLAMNWLTCFPQEKDKIRSGISGSHAMRVFENCVEFLQKHPRFAEKHYFNTAIAVCDMFVAEFV